MAEWQARRFGMFVHWGPVSLKGTEIGWSRKGPRRGHARGGTGTVPMEEYDNLYKKFNPVNFDADEWVTIARQAGMKYIVFTSKHHDGFSNFDSDVADYKITSPDSPYGKDICKQLSDACHREGMKLGWYYSPRDWYHSDFATDHHEGYLKYYLSQIEELCTNYGPIDIFWFDGLDSPRELWGDTPAESFRLIHSLQPRIVLNNRGGLPGDFDTPEQRVGGFNRERPWETCMTICRQWAWKPNDQLKSLEQCLQTLLQTVGGDGNLLFNVGPMPDGRIEPRQVKRLQEMGKWLDRYGEGVYGTRGGPFQPGKWGASTCREREIFLYVMKWPERGPLDLPPIDAQVLEAKRLGGGNVICEQSADGIQIKVDQSDRDRMATAIRLTLDRPAFSIKPMRVHYKSASLAYGCRAVASNVFGRMRQYGADKAVDDDPASRWATDSGTLEATLELDLGRPAAFDQVMIDEPEPYQRVQRFELQAEVDGAWKKIHTGTTIGPRHRIEVQRNTARKVRLVILEATEGPTLWEVQLLDSAATAGKTR